MDITVWITKYALTHGILERQAELTASPGMIRVAGTPSKYGSPNQYYHTDEWFRSRAEAVDNANLRRSDRLGTLRRSIAKLERLNFSGQSAR